MTEFKRSLAVAIAAFGAASILPAAPAGAQTEPYLSQIMWTSAGYCPRGWADANGQLLSINQNQALFSLLGTTYGGNGTVNFALPNLQARTVLSAGQAPGLSNYFEGEVVGAPTATLTTANLPAHTHAASTSIAMRATSGFGDTADPTGNVLADSRTFRIYSTGAPTVALDASSISGQTSLASAGGGQPLPTRAPSLGVRACIAIVGVFPSRS